MFRKLRLSVVGVFALGGLLGGFLGAAIPATTAGAAPCDKKIITIPAWYQGLDCDANGAVQGPVQDADGTSMRLFIWKIGLNIAEIILQIIGYIAMFFVIYGGFLYLTSNGNPEGAARGLKTIINASIGIAIGMSAIALKNLIWRIVTGSSVVADPTAGTLTGSGDAAGMIAAILGTVYFIAGAIAVIVIIINGLTFITASGDSGKVVKAKKGILYGIIGIGIVLAASVVTNFVASRF